MERYIKKLKSTYDEISSTHDNDLMININNLQGPAPTLVIEEPATEVDSEEEKIQNSASLLTEITELNPVEKVQGRDFCNAWLGQFPWLEYDSNTKLMKCSICIKHCKKGVFVKGSKRYRLDGLVVHAQCKKHLQSIKSKEASSKALTVFERAFLSSQKEILKYFRIVHYICDENMAMMKYMSMCGLLKDIGLSLPNTH